MPLPSYPPFQQEMIDPTTGLLTQPWVMFFLSLYGATGGGGGGGGLAPANAEYLVAVPDPGLPLARTVIDTLTIRWNFLTVNEAAANFRDSLGVSVVGRGPNSTGPVSDIVASANNDILMRFNDIVQFMPFADVLPDQGDWTPLTNGDPINPELIFDIDGNCIAIWEPA